MQENKKPDNSYLYPKSIILIARIGSKKHTFIIPTIHAIKAIITLISFITLQYVIFDKISSSSFIAF